MWNIDLIQTRAISYILMNIYRTWPTGGTGRGD
jgi:hypothetical protein